MGRISLLAIKGTVFHGVLLRGEPWPKNRWTRSKAIAKWSSETGFKKGVVMGVFLIRKLGSSSVL